MFKLDALSLSDPQIDQFNEDGFLVVENVIDEMTIEALRASFPRLVAGDFDTGVFPDEWYWREGMSLPDVTRHLGNAWKSDLTIARYVLSAEIGEAARTLSGWPGIRLGQDTIWWKPPHTKPIKLHQDTSFTDFLDPPLMITCWLTLDDTRADAGTLEYIPGSHKWPLTKIPEEFFTPDDYRAEMKHAAAAAGVTPPEPVFIEVPAGSLVFHAGEVWHGSGPNVTDDLMRRSIGIHMLHQDVTFSDRPGGYIYRRYQMTDDPTLNESFFPITAGRDAYRTPWIGGYCRTGQRTLEAEPAAAE
jgi:ectoine hydroxylase-related dioxygenase (phytanoyl-CoA dioxygenase family)